MPSKVNKEKILIVDDDAISRMVLVQKLKPQVEADESVDGEEALGKMRRNNYALVLLDLRIPIKDGFQVLQEMRADPKLKNTPVWVLSNLGMKEEIDRATELGANDYLIKANLRINDLVKKVVNFVYGKI